MITLQDIDRTARANNSMPEPRTIEQVRETLEGYWKKNDGGDLVMARLLYKDGNVTDEAREFARAWLSMYGE